jgi:nucleoside-diphosphate kinase
MGSNEDRYAFNCQWFDAQADLIRTYCLTFYPRDNSIEMYDIKNKRAFLKRSEYVELSMSDLHVGGIITVHARQLKIVDYADAYSRRNLENRKSRTLALIKPDAYNAIGQIVDVVQRAGFVIGRLTTVKMSAQKAEAFSRMQPQSGGPSPSEHAEHLRSDLIVVMELVGENAVESWQAIMGPDSIEEARSRAPGSIRAAIGMDDVRNAVHGSATTALAAEEIEFFFGQNANWACTALFNNCTLCIIRPHAVKHAGQIVARILEEGFEISAMRLWHMDKVVAEEFLDVYKGVLPEYPEMTYQLSNGPALVMEIRQEDAVNAFRQLVGPHDPEVAKHLRPDTIRSKFGVDRVRNCCHCTDLPEDGLLEVEYFFNILYNRKQT